MKKFFMLLALLAVSGSLMAGDIYVSLSTGKNSKEGTKEEPLKSLWKALEKASDGDTIHLAEGIYPGNAKCNWFLIDKAVSIIGGYSADFAARDPLKHRTMFQPLNENNDKKGNPKLHTVVNGETLSGEVLMEVGIGFTMRPEYDSAVLKLTKVK